MKINIETNVSLAPLTTLKVGGPAEHYVKVISQAELAEAVGYAKAQNLSITILSGGSNVLVADDGVDGLVIHNELRGKNPVVTDDVVLLTVAAGEVLDQVVAYTVKEGWWGLENLSHIPGSVGAVPIQNVGAYGVEAKDVVAGVEVFDMETESTTTLSPEDCQFDYRDSIFKHEAGKRYIVTAVTFRLHQVPTPLLSYRDLAERFPDGTSDQSAIRAAVIDIRSQKFPNWHEVGTAGSFFKNPIIASDTFNELKQKHPDLPGFLLEDGRVKVALGYVLDKICCLRGHSEGNVATYHNQALVLIQNGSATAHEVSVFATRVAKLVRDETGIDIEWEVTPVGDVA